MNILGGGGGGGMWGSGMGGGGGVVFDAKAVDSNWFDSNGVLVYLSLIFYLSPAIQIIFHLC